MAIEILEITLKNSQLAGLLPPDCPMSENLPWETFSSFIAIINNALNYIKKIVNFKTLSALASTPVMTQLCTSGMQSANTSVNTQKTFSQNYQSCVKTVT